MSKIGERIAKRSKEVRQFEVHEWGDDGEPLVIYHGPLTAGEMNRVQRKHPNFFANPTLEAFVEVIILKALDKDGEKMFGLEDKAILMREEVGVISRVASELMATEDAGELEKN